MAEASEEVPEEDQLRGGEDECRDGDVEIEGDGASEQSASGVGDAGELGVVAGLSGQPGEAHRQEGVVRAVEGEPEVPAAEAFGEEATATDEGEPVVGGGEEAEDACHGHDEMEVGDDEGGVVQVFIG